ncbi:MAG: DNA polymerase III subunit delta, partial [Elusimicrobia bacterium]|nr:DNA polymerase III subunit delta [Elusimicrobiota bacterium]
SGKLRPVYYLFGEDAVARGAAVQKLKEWVKPDPFNLNELDLEAAEEAVSAANAPPVFADRRLVLLRGTKLLADGRKTLAEYLADPLPSTTLVLQSDDKKPDGKDALASAADKLGGVVVFAPMSEEEAVSRLVAEAKKAGVDLDGEAAETIVEEAGTQWGILRAELDKVLLYAKDRKSVSREDALACLGYRQAANPFDFPKLVVARKRAPALELMARLLEEGVSEFQVLSKITYELNRLLKARRMRAAGVPEAQLFRELRLHPYYGREFLRQAESSNETRLIRSLKLCVETDAALKSKSWLEPKIELERLVARLTA